MRSTRATLGRSQKILYSMMAVLLAFMLVTTLFPVAYAQGDPVVSPTSHNPGTNDRQVARVEKGVGYDGEAISPDDDVSHNDHRYSYTLTAEAYQTITVKYDFQDPLLGGAGVTTFMSEKVFEDLPYGYTFEEGSGKSFEELLPPPAQEISDLARYRDYQVVSYLVHGSDGKFEQDTPVYEDIIIEYIYGPSPESTTTDVVLPMYMYAQNDDFGNSSLQALIDAGAVLALDLYRSTSPFGHTDATKVDSIALSDWDTIYYSTNEHRFTDQERRDPEGRPYYYRVRFSGTNLPACYSAPESTVWTSANYYDPYNPDEAVWINSYTDFRCTTQEITLKIQDENTGLDITEFPYNYPYGSYGTFIILTGGTIPETNKIVAPKYDSEYDSVHLRGVEGTPSEGFFTNEPVMENITVTFKVRPNSYTDGASLSVNTNFESFYNEGLGQNSNELIAGKKMRVTVTPMLNGVLLSDQRIVRESDISYGYLYEYFEGLARYDATTGQQYTYRVEQEFIDGAPELNGHAFYETNPIVEDVVLWGNPSETGYGMINATVPVKKHIIRVDFSEKTAEGTRALNASEIPQDFMYAYSGWLSSTGSVLIESLRGGLVSLEAPTIHGATAQEGSPFTNEGNPITTNVDAEFVYEFDDTATFGLKARVTWGGSTYYHGYDDFWNYEMSGVSTEGAQVKAELYQRVAGSESETLVDTQSLDLSNASDLTSWFEIDFATMKRSDANGNLYEYQVRLSEAPGYSVPKRNGVVAFDLSKSEWTSVESLYSYESHLTLHVNNPSVTYDVISKYVNGSDGSTIDTATKSLFSGCSVDVPWGFGLGVDDISSFNSIYKTNFSTVDPDVREITTASADTTLVYTFSEGAAALSEPAESKNAEQSAAKEPEAAPQGDAPKSEAPQQEQPASEQGGGSGNSPALDKEVPLGGEDAATAPSSSEDSLDPSVGQEQGKVTTQASFEGDASTTRTAAGSNSEGGSSYYSEAFGLFLVGNENVFNIVEVKPGVYTFEMTNGGVFELYAETVGHHPTFARSTPRPQDKSFQYTLTETEQPYGAHSIQLNGRQAVTEIGENIPVSTSFVSQNVGSIEPAHLVVLDSNLYPGADLRVVKHETGNEGVVLSGVKFDLLKKEGAEYKPFRQGLTTVNGLILLDDALPVGDYQLVETQTIEGYVLKTDPVSFTVTKQDTAKDASPIEIKVANDKATTPGPQDPDPKDPDPNDPDPKDPSDPSDPNNSGSPQPKTSGTTSKTGDSLLVIAAILITMATAAGALNQARRKSKNH